MFYTNVYAIQSELPNAWYWTPLPLRRHFGYPQLRGGKLSELEVRRAGAGPCLHADKL